MAGELLSYEPYGVAFRRDEPPLRDLVERALRKLVTARDIGPLYAKWFESRLPVGRLSRAARAPPPGSPG